MALAFCGCDADEISNWGDKLSPWGDKNVENNAISDNSSITKTYRIYVYGAVANEGYHEVEEGEVYLAAIVKAGRLDCSLIPANANSLVDGSQKTIAVHYLENGVEHECYNVNSVIFSLRDSTKFYGLSDEVVNKIADYLETNDVIHNKTVLREVLGEDDYQNYHYKLYVAEADYEEVD
ncbi:MAG: hypothetical protein J1F66_05030 [Clostridiales bacterium]|nr:hypothetical protein [Clostridiales bacterium]